MLQLGRAAMLGATGPICSSRRLVCLRVVSVKGESGAVLLKATYSLTFQGSLKAAY